MDSLRPATVEKRLPHDAKDEVRRFHGALETEGAQFG